MRVAFSRQRQRQLQEGEDGRRRGVKIEIETVGKKRRTFTHIHTHIHTHSWADTHAQFSFCGNFVVIITLQGRQSKGEDGEGRGEVGARWS